MKLRYWLALALSCCMTYAWAQAPAPGKTAQEAPLLPLCLLDGYQYNTCDDPFPGYLPPIFCGTVENNGFLGFIATFSNITFTITPGNCTGTPTGSGIQAEIYGIECNPPNVVSNLYSVSSCEVGGTPIPITITASGLGYGQVYYLMIDGYSGDCCDYQIDVIDYTPISPPPPAAPFINGPTTVYPGQTVTYTIEFPGGNPVVENTCQSPVYLCPGGGDTCFIDITNPTWTIPPGAAIVSYNLYSIDVLWGDMGGEVCVSFPTTCGPDFEVCLEVEVWYANSNCTEFQSPIPFADSLSGAPLFCASNLAPYCSSSGGYTSDTLSGLDTLENGQWFRFQACGSEVVFELFVYNCDQNKGLETGLLLDPDGTGSNLQVISPLQAIGNGYTDTLTFSGLTPEAYYIVLIDGVQGDVCEFQLSHLSGLSEDLNITAIYEEVVEGYIDGPEVVCPFIATEYTLIPPVCEWSITVDGNSSCPIPYQQVCGDAPDSILWVFPTVYDTIWTIPDTAAQFLSDSIGSSISMWFTDTLSGTITAKIVPVMNDSIWIEGSCYVLCGELSILDLCPMEFSIDVDVIYEIEELPPIEICPGESVEFCGEIYFDEGLYTCWDSCTLLIQPVYVIPPQIIDFGLINLCEGDCFEWNGQLFCDPGPYNWQDIGPNGCIEEYFLELEITPSENVTVTQITVLDCDPVTETYVIQVDLFTEHPPLYINGAPMVGTTFISDPIPSGEFYSFLFSDNNPCSIPTVVEGTQICPCFTGGGEMAAETLYACPGDPVTGSYLGGAVLDANDLQVFVLHTEPGNTLGTTLQISSDPEAQFDPGVMSYGTTYYLSSVVGNSIGGQIDWSDDCLSVSPGQPLVFYPSPEVQIQPPDHPLSCLQPEITLVATVSGGSTSMQVQWSKGAQILGTTQTLEVQNAGTYTLQVEDLLTGCTASQNITVLGSTDGPSEILFEEKPPLCFGESTGSIAITEIVGGTAPYQYSVDNSPFSDQLFYENLAPGPHLVKVTDAGGCALEQSLNWPNPTALSADLGPPQEIFSGTWVTLQPAFNFSPAEVVWWVNGQTFDGYELSFQASENAEISLLATDEKGCTAQAALLIDVFEESSTYLANVFSPNGDGLNDYFIPQGGSQIARILDWYIYDRWGNPVFVQKEVLPGDTTRGWDGTQGGKTCPEGVYAYTLVVEYLNGNQEKIKGGLTLVR